MYTSLAYENRRINNKALMVPELWMESRATGFRIKESRGYRHEISYYRHMENSTIAQVFVKIVTYKNSVLIATNYLTVEYDLTCYACYCVDCPTKFYSPYRDADLCHNCLADMESGYRNYDLIDQDYIDSLEPHDPLYYGEYDNYMTTDSDLWDER